MEPANGATRQSNMKLMKVVKGLLIETDAGDYIYLGGDWYKKEAA
jgi:hypothetical protein